VLNYNHLYYFHLAASEGSMTAAAEHLGVTLSTVSEQIRLLERSLGVSLFERSSTGMRLTAAGQQAHQHTSIMFQAGERLAEALGRPTEKSPLVLHIGITATVSRTLATDFLMPVLQLKECYPSIQTSTFADLLRDLRNHDLDLVLCDTEPVEPARRGLEITTLHRPRLVAVSNPKFEPLDTWENVELVQYRQGSAYRWEIDLFLDEKGYRPHLVGESDDSFLLLEAVIRGGFVAFVPRSVARDALSMGRVKALLTLEPGGAGIHALYHDGESASLARRAVQMLAEYATSALDA
jgi:LysR family transcriptional regulator, transcriptional activator of nhaA